MPTKNVYVSDADVPLFEQAAELAGALSTAVSTGLRLYVAQRERERKQTRMSTIEVTVDDGPVVTTKRFTGRQILRFEQGDGLRRNSYRVYVTAKGQYAVYTRNDPNWSAISRADGQGAGAEDADAWNGDWWNACDRTLSVYPDIASMSDALPTELVAALTSAEQRPAVEDLDI